MLVLFSMVVLHLGHKQLITLVTGIKIMLRYGKHYMLVLGKKHMLKTMIKTGKKYTQVLGLKIILKIT